MTGSVREIDKKYGIEQTSGELRGGEVRSSIESSAGTAETTRGAEGLERT